MSSCLSSLLVVLPSTRHLCRPYRIASDSLAIPAHARRPNRETEFPKLCVALHRIRRNNFKSQDDSQLDWRTPADELSLDPPEPSVSVSAFPVPPAPCCSLQKWSQASKASLHMVWRWKSSAITRHGRTSDCSRFKHAFFHVLMRKEILLKHLRPKQDELSGKKHNQSSMRL